MDKRPKISIKTIKTYIKIVHINLNSMDLFYFSFFSDDINDIMKKKIIIEI